MVIPHNQEENIDTNTNKNTNKYTYKNTGLLGKGWGRGDPGKHGKTLDFW